MWLDGLAVAFVLARLLHGLFYVADWPVLRSHSWRQGILCVIALFGVAALDGPPWRREGLSTRRLRFHWTPVKFGFHALGTRGDVQPYLALAAALQKPGMRPC